MLLGSSGASALLRPPFAAATLRAADLARRAALDSYPLFLRSASTPPAVFEALSPLAGWRAAEIQVRLHRAGSAPFAANHGRIKRRYIVDPQPAGAEARSSS